MLLKTLYHQVILTAQSLLTLSYHLSYYPSLLASSLNCSEMGGKWSHSCCLAGFASKICSKQHIAFLFSFHLTFFHVSLSSRRCILTMILTELEIWRNLIYFIRSDFHMIGNLSIAVHVFWCIYWHHFQKMRDCCQDILTGLLISEACHFKLKWLLFKTYEIFYFAFMYIETFARSSRSSEKSSLS